MPPKRAVPLAECALSDDLSLRLIDSKSKAFVQLFEGTKRVCQVRVPADAEQRQHLGQQGRHVALATA